MRDFLPVGLKGLLLASFFAAYMSTISTQLNWGSSYIVNDVYRRFIKKEASEAHYVLVSRAATHYYFASSLELLTPLMNQFPHHQSLLRPANLEDVFLKLTGRSRLE